MITIAVLAIGSALAYPSFSGVMRSNRVATSTNGLLAAFNLARSEAIRTNRGGGVCPSLAGLQCDGADWNVGYLAYADVDGSGDWSVGDRAIRYFEGNDALSLTATPGAGEPGGSAVERVAFERSGRVRAAVDFTLKIADCKPGDDYQRAIVVIRSGQARMQKQECS
jgi:type IV fimbrial biogenesis protein FimT